MVGGQFFHRALQLERWQRLAGWRSRRSGRFPSPITSDTVRILNRARADILRELVLFFCHHGPRASQALAILKRSAVTFFVRALSLRTRMPMHSVASPPAGRG